MSPKAGNEVLEFPTLSDEDAAGVQVEGAGGVGWGGGTQLKDIVQNQPGCLKGRKKNVPGLQGKLSTVPDLKSTEEWGWGRPCVALE